MTDKLGLGPHALGAVLGDGWYCGHIAWFGRNQYGKQPLGLIQLEIEFEDGTRETIATDESWGVMTGPILASDMVMGESYDARLEFDGWASPGFDAAHWMRPLIEPLGEVPLEPLACQPIRVWDELPARTVSEPSPGHFVFDLGQNMVGWARLKVSGPAGTAVKIRFAEMLNPDGTIYTTNLRKAAATDTYTLRGNGGEVYEPSFTFHGFRYVELTGYPGRPSLDTLTGVVVGSDTPDSGSFETSNSLVNQLQHNIYWGQRGNYLAVPTDCPQRDERLGWMGDAQVFAGTGAFNCDIAPFMTKWMRDVIDAQSAEGGFCDVSPRVTLGDGSPAWGDAGVIVPWTMYKVYGDKRLLANCFPAMVKWVEYVRAANPDLLWLNRRNNDYGDWLNIEAETPHEVLATAYFAHSADLVARSAAVLGKKQEADRYRALFAQIRAKFNASFVSADGAVKGDTQTGYLLALSFGLVPDALRGKAFERLVADIVDKKKTHLSTGFLGVRLLNEVLSQNGRTDLAYKLLLNDTFPSWGYSIRQGATTIWERWDGWTEAKGFQDPGMNSFNHYSLGSVGEWMYSVVGGIRLDESHPAYRRFVIAPEPGNGIDWAKAGLDTVHGRIECAWRVSGSNLEVDITVPANTDAKVRLPTVHAESVTEGGVPAVTSPGVKLLKSDRSTAAYEVGAGTYRFVSPR